MRHVILNITLQIPYSRQSTPGGLVRKNRLNRHKAVLSRNWLYRLTQDSVTVDKRKTQESGRHPVATQRDYTGGVHRRNRYRKLRNNLSHGHIAECSLRLPHKHRPVLTNRLRHARTSIRRSRQHCITTISAAIIHLRDNNIVIGPNVLNGGKQISSLGHNREIRPLRCDQRICLELLILQNTALRRMFHIRKNYL